MLRMASQLNKHNRKRGIPFKSNTSNLLFAKDGAPDGKPIYSAGVNMYYTYIIESIESSSKHYIGYSSDLRQRLLDHNAGKCPSTAKYRPWKLIQYTAFESVERALAFEKYLKSGSGHAFAKRHFFDKK